MVTKAGGQVDETRLCQEINKSFTQMKQEMCKKQVVCSQASTPRVVQLVGRDEAKRMKGVLRYHAFQNPSSRKRGDQQWDTLMKDWGSFVTLCGKFAEEADKPDVTFSCLLKAFGGAQIRVFENAKYGKIGFVRWLAFAEDIDFHVEPNCWNTLTGMGSGAASGINRYKLHNYDAALSTCTEIAAQRQKVEASSVETASVVQYKLDDLVCFLCMSASKELKGSPSAAVLPVELPAITPEDDLCDIGKRPTSSSSSHRIAMSDPTGSSSSHIMEMVGPANPSSSHKLDPEQLATKKRRVLGKQASVDTTQAAQAYGCTCVHASALRTCIGR